MNGQQLFRTRADDFGGVRVETQKKQLMMVERKITSNRNSNIVIHNDTVYLSGQSGGSVGTITDQTKKCLRCVDALLSQAGSSQEHILSAIIWLADMDDYDEMNEVWDAWIPQGHAPARACGAARLAEPEFKIEVIITAALI